jgi:hypothetical protein
MGNIDNVTFERRGARGCSNSDYNLCRTTCCDSWGVEDNELSDLYLNGADTSKVISLLVAPGQHIVCPYCGSERWALRPVTSDEAVPHEWRWALDHSFEIAMIRRDPT